MKKILAWLIAAQCMGCAKDDTPPEYRPTVDALKNGANWKASSIVRPTSESNARCINQRTVEILIGTFSKEGFSREVLHLTKLPKKIGLYSIQVYTPCWVDSLPGASYHTLQDDGDVLGHTYRVDTTAENFVQLTQVTTNEISGSFKIQFVVERRSSNTPFESDTLHFTEGKFKTKIVVGN